MTNEEFENIIKNCYVKILKRQPDKEGFEYFLDLMKKIRLQKKKL